MKIESLRPDLSPHPDETTAVVNHFVDGEVVVVLTGDLDCAGVEMVENEVRWAVTQADASVTIDCSGVGFVDSSGLRLLVQAESMAACRQEHFRLRSCRPQLRSLLRIAGLDESMYGTEPDTQPE